MACRHPQALSRAQPRASAHLKDQLASEMARFAQALRFGGLRQSIELDLGRSDASLLEELRDALERCPRACDRRPERGAVIALPLGCLPARGDEGCPPSRPQ